MSQATNVSQVYVAPGNAGTAMEAKLINVDIGPMDFGRLISFAKTNQVSLTVVGPELPLVEGIVDEFKAAGLCCFGPSKAAAQLEGSKLFTKQFLARHNIPTANYQSFTELQAALNYLQQQNTPVVIKADGLAAGKGVVVAENLAAAESAVRDMLSSNRFGEAGQCVVIEEFLEGEEASFIVMADGEHVLPMATSQDHKRVGEGDTGPNTGGMGAYSPAPVVSEAVYQRIMQRIIHPTLAAMAAEGMPYSGFLYAGLMIDNHGNPKVIEYNCRFGDPETQPIMLRMKSDLAQLCLEATQGNLDKCNIQWDSKPAVGVVLSAEGYPGKYQRGEEIMGLNAIATSPNTKVFHAGTRMERGKIYTDGGRVLCATSMGENIQDAAANAYICAEKIQWPGRFMRKDIAHRAIARCKP